eukprot:gene6477-8909_t
MLLRTVNSLPLSQSQIELLTKRGFRSISDFVIQNSAAHGKLTIMQPFDLVAELGCSNRDALEIIQCVTKSVSNENQFNHNIESLVVTDKITNNENIGGNAICSTNSISTKDLIEKIRHNRPIVSFCRSIDQMLGGGVCIGQVTEFCGVPGIGNGAESIYIDTEGSFMVERVAEMASELSNHLMKLTKANRHRKENELFLSQLSAAEIMTTEKFLQGIHVYRVHEQAEQIAVINQLYSFIKSSPNKIRLIIIDSIAYHFRQDLSDHIGRSRLLSTISQTLHKIANELQ